MALARRIGLALRTYREARRAVRRQYSLAQVRETQALKLQRLMRYCFENIKYYREVFEGVGIKPEQLQSVTDLQRLPFLTKEELRNRWWDFLPRELGPCRVSRTSGSTGIPVCILSDSNSRVFNSAGVIRYRCAVGMSFFGGAIVTPLKTETELQKRPHWTFLQGFHKTYYVNPYVGSAENVRYAGRLFGSLKRPALVGITPAISALAYRIGDGFFPPLRPCIVLTSGQCLEPQVRKLLESTFEAKVADIYACNEAGDVAWQCLEGSGYHVNADNIIVEIVKDGKVVKGGEAGEVAITNLNRYAMPIIRYKNGDIASFATQDCSCGCKLPILGGIVGRSGEDIYLPEGKSIPWNRVKGLMNHPQIRRFQLVQNADSSFEIRYVAERDANTAALERLLLARYRKLLGLSISVSMQRVERIAPSASGKIKLVVSSYRPEAEVGGTERSESFR